MDTKLFDRLSKGSFEFRLLNYMNAVGIRQIEVKYSGGGDSGGMDEIVFSPSNPAVEKGIEENFEKELCQPIYNRHGGFADSGGFHVNGSVFYDAVEKRIWLEGTDYETEYDYDDEEDEGTTTESCWEDPPCYANEDYEHEEKDSVLDDSTSHEFVFMYARDFLKGRLPEEIHNRLLIEAANGSESAVNYIKFCKENK